MDYEFKPKTATEDPVQLCTTISSSLEPPLKTGGHRLEVRDE